MRKFYVRNFKMIVGNEIVYNLIDNSNLHYLSEEEASKIEAETYEVFQKLWNSLIHDDYTVWFYVRMGKRLFTRKPYITFYRSCDDYYTFDEKDYQPITFSFGWKEVETLHFITAEKIMRQLPIDEFVHWANDNKISLCEK